MQIRFAAHSLGHQVTRVSVWASKAKAAGREVEAVSSMPSLWDMTVTHTHSQGTDK